MTNSKHNPDDPKCRCNSCFARTDGDREVEFDDENDRN